jgi:hypothetical protein
VVVTVRAVPGVGPVMTSGVVTQVRARHEGASFGSDVFLIADGVLPAQVQEVTEVTTTRVEPECYVPPRPGEWARRATGEERARVLYFEGMEQKVPVSPGRDGDLIYLNLEFLDGTAAAMSRSAASPVWRPRPASRCSCLTRSSAAVRWADGVGAEQVIHVMRPGHIRVSAHRVGRDVEDVSRAVMRTVGVV